MTNRQQPLVKFIEGEPARDPHRSESGQIVAALQERPGVWAEVGRYPTHKRSSADSRRTAIKSHAKKNGVSLEAAVRSEGSEVVVYARVVQP